MENKKGRRLLFKARNRDADVGAGRCLETWLLRKDPRVGADSSLDPGLGTTSSTPTAFVSLSP